jgi:hypothetical protein
VSAGHEQQLKTAENEAVVARGYAESYERMAREATIEFMDLALEAHWSWETIGRRLAISGTAARRYYQRNRRKVHATVT